jgi:hypothetical protein
MIEIVKDMKSDDNYIITKTDSEGFHKQLNVSSKEMEVIIVQFDTLYN